MQVRAQISVIVHNDHIADVLIPCAVMLAFAAVFLSAGILRFRFE